jgi:hypothetical protein
MYSKRFEPRERADKWHPNAKERNEARLKAAIKITKYAPGHKDRVHDQHGSKR